MKQQIIKLKNKLLLVELPEGINGEDVSINHNQDDYEQLEFQYPTHEFRGMQCYDNILLPKGYSYKSIGKLTDITESQFAKWVEEFEGRFENYESLYYTSPGSEFNLLTAKESFFSKLQAGEIYFENPLGKKPHLGMFIEQRGNCVEDYDKAFKEWQEAQQKVWNINQCYLFVILN